NSGPKVAANRPAAISSITPPNQASWAPSRRGGIPPAPRPAAPPLLLHQPGGRRDGPVLRVFGLEERTRVLRPEIGDRGLHLLHAVLDGGILERRPADLGQLPHDLRRCVLRHEPGVPVG